MSIIWGFYVSHRTGSRTLKEPLRLFMGRTKLTPLYPDLRNFRSPIYESVLQISDALTRSLPPHAFSCCFPHLPFCLLVIHEIVLLTTFLPFPV